MRKEAFERLEQVISKFTVKSVRSIQKDEQDKFIQSIAREYTLNSGDKVVREEIIKGGMSGSAVIVIPVVGEEIITVVEPRVLTRLTVGVGFPSGYINLDEDPIHSAKRELEEETGYSSDNLIKLDEFYQDEGCSSALNVIYLALDCKKIGEQHLDKDEYIEYIPFTYDEIIELEKRGYMMGGHTKLAILKMKDYFKGK